MQNEKLYKTIIWIMLGALAAVVLVVAYYHLKVVGTQEKETTCQAGEIRRITVIYPDGDEGEPKTTYECIKEQK